MDGDEFDRWIEFYKMQPFDDYHRFHRPAALIATPTGENYDERLAARLEWLQHRPAPEGGLSEADQRTMKALLGG